MISWQVIGVDQAVSRFQVTGTRIHERLAFATITGTQLVAGDASKRFFPASRQSVQDSEQFGRIKGGGRAYSSSYSADGLTGFVSLEPHVSKVTQAVVDVLTRLGQAARVQHTGLWIDLRKPPLRGARGRFSGRSASKGYTDKSGLTFLSFAAHSSGRERLGEWSQRLDKGRQERAKSVLLGGQALRILSLGPALEHNRAAILDGYRHAVSEGING